MPTPQLHLPDLDEVGIGAPDSPTDAPPGPPPPRRLLPRLMGMASTWLPLLVLALAALFTWWLVKNTPISQPASAREARHAPDYTLERFAIHRFDAQSRHVAELQGESLRHFPQDDTIEIDRIALDAQLPDGRPLTARAQLGVVTPSTDEVLLQGAAAVDGQAPDGTPLALRGERLRAHMASHRVQTDAPVTVHWGSSRIDAAGLDYTPNSQQVRLTGPARASLVRPPPGGRAAP